MQDQSRGCLDTLEHEPLALERQYLHQYVGDLVFLRGHVIEVLESSLTLGRRLDVRPQAADQGTAHELRRYQVAIDQAYAPADGSRTREFAQPNLPIGVRIQVYRSSQLDREGAVRVVQIQVLRGFTE